MVIDREQFRENFEFFDKEIVLDIINMFIDEYPERMQKIHKDDTELDELYKKLSQVVGQVVEELKELKKEFV